MGYVVAQWPPDAVYPGEVQKECPEAAEVIDLLIRGMRAQGPSPAGYRVKALGARLGGLWQVNLKIEKRQVRLLYAPYGQTIVLFRIHRKGSPQEQTRAYELARRRKRDYESRKQLTEQASHGGNRTVH
jgi:hypothetical protein